MSDPNHTPEMKPRIGPFGAAERKGRTARLEGKPRSACPYPDWRTDRGSITFSRAWRTAWFRGWDSAVAGG